MRDSDHDDAEERAIRKDVRSCIGPTIPLRRRWVDLIMRGPIAALLARARAAEGMNTMSSDDTRRLITREMTPAQKERMAFNLCAPFGTEFVETNEAFALAVYAEAYAMGSAPTPTETTPSEGSALTSATAGGEVYREQTADHVLAEMIAVATADEGSELADEWHLDCRAKVDLWQAALQPALGHHHGFPSRSAASPVGEDALREAFEATVLALGEAVFALRGAGCQRATLKALDAQNRARTALASPTQQAPDQGGGGSGWIIQDPTSLRYRTWAGGPCWTVKEDMALQFHRKADAERFAAADRNPWHVVPAAPKANTGEEETLSHLDWTNCEAVAKKLRSTGEVKSADVMDKFARIIKRTAIAGHLARLQADADDTNTGDA